MVGAGLREVEHADPECPLLDGWSTARGTRWTHAIHTRHLATRRHSSTLTAAARTHTSTRSTADAPARHHATLSSPHAATTRQELPCSRLLIRVEHGDGVTPIRTILFAYPFHIGAHALRELATRRGIGGARRKSLAGRIEHCPRGLTTSGGAARDGCQPNDLGVGELQLANA
jgi:hypothetical protein